MKTVFLVVSLYGLNHLGKETLDGGERDKGKNTVRDDWNRWACRNNVETNWSGTSWNPEGDPSEDS